MRPNQTLRKLEQKGAQIEPIAPEMFRGRACEVWLSEESAKDDSVDFSEKLGLFLSQTKSTRKKLSKVTRGLDLLVLRGHTTLPENIGILNSYYTQTPHADNHLDYELVIIHRDGRDEKSVETFAQTPEEAVLFFEEYDPQVFAEAQSERFSHDIDDFNFLNLKTVIFKIAWNYKMLVKHALGIEKTSMELALAVSEWSHSRHVLSGSESALKKHSYQISYPKYVPTTVLIKNWRLLHGAFVTKEGQPDSHYIGYRM